MEGKIVQHAIVEVLNAIHETDFLGFSYGFRPGRGPHDALDALTVAIENRKVNWLSPPRPHLTRRIAHASPCPTTVFPQANPEFGVAICPHA